MSFHIRALPAGLFADLPGLSEADLAAHLVQRQTVDSCPGYPCRVSLEDARIGETVYLLHFTHQPAATPFRASHAIFVREHAVTANLPLGEVPDMICNRMISLRAFNADGMLVNADVVSGEAVSAQIEAFFQDPLTDYIHLHFAKQGCFAARVERA